MAKVIIDPYYIKQLEELDGLLYHANERKLVVLFEALGIPQSLDNLAIMKGWELITISVPDKQMAMQLNKLATYMPKLLFVFSTDIPLFTVSEGFKKRRVRKER
ncbi:hypothetical protein L1S35_07755 [Flavobacterium sp. AS60]|uniref:hypothetical protein n=1 Tax=Flavobacterium anseongense TaxID=2910677 RepID=UPI001F1F04BF|nr:hypothetical protein [Flavobacterium sp. AS60]MCF6129563.1 hypothetical protein [Flavobacterium sp. AS60]